MVVLDDDGSVSTLDWKSSARKSRGRQDGHRYSMKFPPGLLDLRKLITIEQRNKSSDDVLVSL